MDCGGFRRLFRCLAIIGTTFAITWGSALAAPPQESPGNNEHPPGQQKHEAEQPGQPESPPGQQKKEAEQPGAPESPPGQQKKEDVAAATPAGNGVDRSADRPAKPKSKRTTSARAPAESSRYTNAQGKPKRNVPAAAETAPAASASGPGKSGIHKLTICHKGHAITVDVHALAAHLKHGDTFLPAGTKGRASCGTRHAPPRSHSHATAAKDQDGPSRSHANSVAGSSTEHRRAASAAHPAPIGATPPSPTSDVAGASETKDVSDPNLTTPTATELPFTGSTLAARLALAGILLIAVGCTLALGRGAPVMRAAARARTSRLRRARN